MGRIGEALAEYRDVRRLATAEWGPLHEHTLTVEFGFGAFLGKSGDAEGARDIFQFVEDQLRLQRGPLHVSTLLSQIQLAIWTATAGNPQRAMNMLLRTLIRLRDSLGKNNHLVKQFEEGLAVIRGGAPKGVGGKR